MTVSVSNTNLNDSFNAWRLNTNFAATVISNNVVTVSRAGSANRGGVAKGNGHIAGTFTANELRTTTLRSGNTSDSGGWLYVNSNTSINATSLTVTANTIFQGNVNFTTAGTDRLILGDISRIRVTGGTRGQFLRIGGSTDTPNFKSLTLRDITDMSSNAANLILSGTNSTFSDNGDSPHLILTNGTDRAHLYLASDAVAGDSDVYLNLVATDDGSSFVIADSSNTAAHSFFADGTQTSTGRITSAGLTSSGTILPNADDQVDLGSSGAEFKDLYIDGIAYVDELSMGTAAGQGVSTSLIPKTDAIGNLGSTTRKWGTVWADNTNGGLGVFKTLGVSQTLNVNGAVTMATTLGVTGVATLSNDASVGGQLNVTENIVATGNTQVGGTLSVTGATNLSNTLTVTGTTTLNGDVTLGDATADTITFTGSVAGNIIPQTDGAIDLGSSLKEFKDLYIDGVAYVDELSMATGVGEGVATSLIPKTDAVGNLGESTRKWGTVWADTTNGGDGVFKTLGVSGALVVNGDITINSDNMTLVGNTVIGDASTDTVTFTAQIDSDFDPQTGSQRDMGSTLNRWHNVYANNVLANNVTTDNNLTVLGNLSVSGSTTIASGQILSVDSGVFSTLGVLGQFTANGNIDLGNATTDSITVTGQFDSALIPITDDLYDLGTATKQWQDIWIDGTASIDILAVDETSTFTGSVDINNDVDISGTLSNDGTTVIGANAKLHANNTISAKTITTTMIANTMTSGGNFGSVTQVPIFQVNDRGQVTGIREANTASVKAFGYTQSNNTIRLATNSGTIYTDVIDAATANTDGSNGGLTNRGVASFDSGDFTVSSGFVSLKNATTGAVLAINGTANEVNVSRSTGTVTVGLPDDVTVTGQLNVGENVVISGNLIVSGTTTTVDTETVTIADNIILLNSNFTGDPAVIPENGGITIERGIGTNKSFLWDETNDRWTIGTETLIAGRVGLDSTDYINFTDNTKIISVVNNVERLAVNTSGIDVSGSIVADSTITASSDRRLKENIETIPNALEKVQAITGVTFDRNDLEDSRQTGVIAQDVEAVLPEAVRENDEGIKSVAYGNMVGLLIEAIKELKAEIDELKKHK